MRVDPDHVANQGCPETEFAFYQSGLLDSRTKGLRPSRCYGWYEREDGVIWLWLEDLSDAQQPPWSPAQHFAAARDIGRFNGSWPEGLDADATWLVRDPGVSRWEAQWRHGAFDDLRKAVDNPTVRKMLSGTLFERALAVEATVDQLRKATESLPRCFSHGDSHPRNLFPPDEGAGMPQTVAIDWAGVGTDVLGIDGGTSAGSALTWGVDEAEQTVRIESEIFASYLQGLRDTEWTGDESTARLGYLCAFVNYAVACLLIGVKIALGDEMVEARWEFFEKRLGRTLAEIPAALGAVFADCLSIIDETNKLLDDYLS